MATENQPLIVRKIVVEGGHGHHGGAWKVAYADFVTAMMAFFLLLWLLSTASDETLKGLAEFFSDAQQNRGEPGGVGGVLEGITVTPFEPITQPTSSPMLFQMTVPLGEESDGDSPSFELDLAAELGAEGNELEEPERFEAEREARQFEQAKAAILDSLEGSPELEAYKDNLRIEQTPEGLRIEILDRERTAMFPVGSAQMYPAMRKLVAVVAHAVRDLPNKLSIRGHTDARPFASGAGYDNWRLSADRANATREALEAAGLPSHRFAEVIGKADTRPLVPEDPLDPRNRRISILLLSAAPKGADKVAGAGEDAAGATEGDRALLPKGAQAPSPPQSEPAGASTPPAAQPEAHGAH